MFFSDIFLPLETINELESAHIKIVNSFHIAIREQ